MIETVEPEQEAQASNRWWRWSVLGVTAAIAVVGAVALFGRHGGEKTTTAGVTATFHVGGGPNGIASLPSGLWLGLTGPIGDLHGAFAHVSSATGQVDRRIALHGVPSFVHEVGDAVWLENGATWSDSGPGTLMRFDRRSGALLAKRRFTVPVFDFAPAGRATWVVVGRSPARLVPIDQSTMKTVGPALTISPSRVIALAAGAGALWAGASEQDKLLRIDVRSRRVTSVGVGHFPVGVVVADGKVWVGNRNSNTVSMVDASTMKVLRTIRVGGLPSWLGAAGGSIWVASQRDGTVYRLSARNGDRIGEPIRVASSSGVEAAAHVVATGAGAVWVTSMSDQTVSRIDPRG